MRFSKGGVGLSMDSRSSHLDSKNANARAMSRGDRLAKARIASSDPLSEERYICSILPTGRL